MFLAVLFLSRISFLEASDSGLVDNPIVGEAITYLDGNDWTASAQFDGKTRSIPATVPGDLLSDLLRAKVIGEPYYGLNFKNASIWNDHVWTFSKHFDLSIQDGEEVILVFDGIKMGAEISVNGHILGNAANQFLRYNFTLDNTILSNGKNTLEVAFDPKVPVDGRFMACTGGWDWAPYSNTFEAGSQAHTFSKGLWKSVYLVSFSKAAITHIVPQIFYRGDYPVSRLDDTKHAGFDVHVNVHLRAGPSKAEGSITVSGDWGKLNSAAFSLNPHEEGVVSVHLDASGVKLWWPVGLGSQNLWNIHVSLGSQKASRRLGFRHFAIVTGNDTDPKYVNDSVNAEGTSAMGMFFRVNGVPIWSRGANMIPMDELEGRYSADAHRQLVKSAVEGKMNTLRVWVAGCSCLTRGMMRAMSSEFLSITICNMLNQDTPRKRHRRKMKSYDIKFVDYLTILPL